VDYNPEKSQTALERSELRLQPDRQHGTPQGRYLFDTQVWQYCKVVCRRSVSSRVENLRLAHVCGGAFEPIDQSELEVFLLGGAHDYGRDAALYGQFHTNVQSAQGTGSCFLPVTRNSTRRLKRPESSRIPRSGSNLQEGGEMVWMIAHGSGSTWRSFSLLTESNLKGMVVTPTESSSRPI